MPSKVLFTRPSWCVLFAALLILAACQHTKTDNTSLVIEVHSNLPADGVDQLVVVATVTEPVSRSFMVDTDHGFPFRFGLTPAHSSSEAIRVDVTALKGGQPVASVHTETKFSPGIARTVIVELTSDVDGGDGGTQPADASNGCAEGSTYACDCGDIGKGLRRCTDGSWSACVASCADTGLFGPCAKGTRTCDETQGAPKWGACSVAPQMKDTCEPNADENCNGNQNEGCPCTRGAKRSCADGGCSARALPVHKRAPQKDFGTSVLFPQRPKTHVPLATTTIAMVPKTKGASVLPPPLVHVLQAA